VHPSERLSPHGLRAGLMTEADLAGAPDEQAMKHTRHADLFTMTMLEILESKRSSKSRPAALRRDDAANPR
jgi:hypothetical protein